MDTATNDVATANRRGAKDYHPFKPLSDPKRKADDVAAFNLCFTFVGEVCERRVAIGRQSDNNNKETRNEPALENDECNNNNGIREQQQKFNTAYRAV